MQNNVLEIIDIIRSNYDTNEKLKKLAQYHDNDLALALEELDVNERKTFYQIFNEEKLSDIISYLDDAKPYLEEMGLDKATDVIEEMDSDDAVDVLEDLDDGHREKLLSLMDDEVKEDIELITSYEDDEVGSLMTNNYIAISQNDTVKTAMNTLISLAGENDNFTIIYVLDDQNHFYGTIDLRDLLIARSNTPLESIIKTSYPKFMDKEPIMDAYHILVDYDLDSYPVLNQEGSLLGVITKSDIIELVENTMTDDYARLAGLVGNAKDRYSLFSSIKSRIPWLVVLLFLDIIISFVLSRFSGVMSQLPVIVFFQSLVLDLSGNVGTQSLAVTIRLLSDEKTNRKTMFLAVLKEVAIGFFNGLILGVVSTIVVGLFIYLLNLEIISGQKTTAGLAFTVSSITGVSLLIAVTLSNVTGTLIPLFFKKIHVDPAVASGPFITTINDIVAVIVYYGLAWLLLMNIVL